MLTYVYSSLIKVYIYVPHRLTFFKIIYCIYFLLISLNKVNNDNKSDNEYSNQ